ncbi:hypothetical protein VA603_03495 [Stenotrophomonas sp. MH1]|uniref:Uncharacterized protein n=1 Tax=Stenotrophomonas capsici TaxID=3110230 RepID=A0ABU5V1G4_9GAMM|nr:hypothetical protein [Stenotrophomonas sp. MH1]MEA5666599.1 hypothetical protein [Stenotrophomonas sp. MH1]
MSLIEVSFGFGVSPEGSGSGSRDGCCRASELDSGKFHRRYKAKPMPALHTWLEFHATAGIGHTTAAHISRVSVSEHAIGLRVAWAKADLLPPAGIDSEAGNVVDSSGVVVCMHRLPHSGSTTAVHA